MHSINLVRYDDGTESLLDDYELADLVRATSNAEYDAFWACEPVKLADGRTVTLVSCNVAAND